MKKSIAVLLTCHNRKIKTLKCLSALFGCNLPVDISLHTFLVDDGSTDGTALAVSQSYQDVTIIEGNGQLFWNRGMSLAWETAVTKDNFSFFLWLNDDTILFDNALVQMLGQSEKFENKRIIVGATCSEDNWVTTYSGFTFPKKRLEPNATWQDCDYFNGNIVLIPQLVFSKVGFIDKKFRHALGDFDYGMRAKKLGFIHALSPVHLGKCENHESDPIWRNSSYPLLKRLKHLYSPLGNHPIEFFVFDFRHNGLFPALFHFFTIHTRSVFPTLWKTTKK